MKITSVLVSMLLLLSCQNPAETTAAKVTNSSAQLPDYLPEMLAPGIISRDHFEGHASITPDGKEVYFAIYSNDHRYSTIAYAKLLDDQWSLPEIVPFSGAYSDGSPALSPDGQQLFFSSRRPQNGTNPTSNNDLWVSQRKAGAWQKPIRLPATINSPYNDFSPSADREGNLYFCSNRPGGFGDMDVYYAALVDGEYQKAVLLDSSINTALHEGNVGVSPDGNLLFLMIQHKPGDFGMDDIHVSKRVRDQWGPLQNLGPDINTYTYDFAPKISPDGKTLYFSSRVSPNFYEISEKLDFQMLDAQLQSPLNGLGNIYHIELEKIGIRPIQ